MSNTRTPRPRVVKQKAPDRPAPVQPQPFDKQAFKIRQLLGLNAQLTEQVADLQATNAELMEYLKANAELLELRIDDGTQQAPPPPVQEVPNPEAEPQKEGEAS